MYSLSVVKVGGSLFDLPDLGQRLTAWITESGLSSVLLVPGGGPTTDALRQLDRCHRLGEEVSHWLALRALTLNACFLSTLLPVAQIVKNPQSARAGGWAILDCHSFVFDDERHPDHLPHSWSVTGDSVAAQAARRAQAEKLFLLKSLTVPESKDWHEGARRGWVDAYFPQAAAGLNVAIVNLRDWAPVGSAVDKTVC